MNQELSNELVILITTEANNKLAESLAKELLERGLAACVSFFEVRSHFYWKGNLEKSNEVQLFIKTPKEMLQNLLTAINELHSYQNPELLYWNVSSSDAYCNWVKEVTPAF